MPSYDNKVLTGDQLVYFSGLVKTALAAKADASALANKQDALVFNTAYNASSNKVATMSDIPSISLSVSDEQSSGFLSFDGQELTINWDQPLGDILTFSDEGNDNLLTLADVVDDIDNAIAAKQDALVFNTAYNASSNKVATMSDITTALGSVGSFSFEIVQSLPQSNISTSKIYLVAKQTSGTNQVYTEYAYVNNAWEIIGDTSMTIDALSNSEVATIWAAASAT